MKILDFPGGSVVNNLPVNVGDKVQSLGWEDPLEEDMATHSSILAWRNPWTEESGGLQSIASQRIRHDLATEHAHTQHAYMKIPPSEVSHAHHRLLPLSY